LLLLGQQHRAMVFVHLVVDRRRLVRGQRFHILVCGSHGLRCKYLLLVIDLIRALS
jgi:hypothetical protein